MYARFIFAMLLLVCGFALVSVNATAISDVILTYTTACATSVGGAVKCWGNIRDLGIEQGSELDITDSVYVGDEPDEMGLFLPEVDLGTNRTVQSLAYGRSFTHTCALLDQGAVKCWGFNLNGALGGAEGRVGDTLGSMGDALPEVDLGSNYTAVQVAVGRHHTCAVLDTGEVKCWGASFHGALGKKYPFAVGRTPLSMGDYITPINLGTNRTALQVACGKYFTCAILDNHQVKCWGLGDLGQLGNGDNGSVGDLASQMGDNLKPVDLGTNRSALQIDCGDKHACVLLDNYQMKCWGDGAEGQIGSGRVPPYQVGNAEFQMGDNLSAVDLGDGMSVLQISTGTYHTCALLSNHKVKCFGLGSIGALGLGSTDTIGDEQNEMGNKLRFVDVGRYRTVVAVFAGFFRTCALLENDTLKCWGSNGIGKLGYGDKLPRGGEPGTMGDALSSLDLAFGLIPPSPAPSISPTAAPVNSPSASPTLEPTRAPTNPTVTPSVPPTTVNKTEGPVDPGTPGTEYLLILPILAAVVIMCSGRCVQLGVLGAAQVTNTQQQHSPNNEGRQAPVPGPESNGIRELMAQARSNAPHVAVAVKARTEGEFPVAKVIRPSL